MTGVALALLAGGWWAAYILLSARIGRAFPGGTGLALAMVVASVLVLPLGIAEGGSALLRPEVLRAGLGVAVLSSVIPYSLELEALRRLPAHVFGVLMSLEPAAAAIAGPDPAGPGRSRRTNGRGWRWFVECGQALGERPRYGNAPSSATASMCGVCGNMSTGLTDSSV